MSFKMHVNLLIFVVIILFKPICMQFSECLNPQRVRGYCIPIQMCSYLMNVARYSQQNYEANNFLRQSQCGFNGYTVYGCCPTTQLAPQPMVNQIQQPPKSIIAGNIITKPFLPRPPVCGTDLEDRIFGGTKTGISEFPWFALLKYSKPGTSEPSFFCSGTLINDRYVITAAHCVHPKLIQRNRLIGVRLGEWDLATSPDCDESFVNEKICGDPHFDVGIEETVIQEKYSPQSFNQHNDIALLRLSQRVKFTEFIKPICIQASSSGSFVGQSVIVAGFGKTESAVTSNIKLKVSLNVVENDKCNQVFRTEGRRLFEGQICAGGKKGIDSCRGDSGGPMMLLVSQNRVAYWTLVGIVSYGSSPCGIDNRPAVYTKLDNFIEWIESKIRN